MAVEHLQKKIACDRIGKGHHGAVMHKRHDFIEPSFCHFPSACWNVFILNVVGVIKTQGYCGTWIWRPLGERPRSVHRGDFSTKLKRNFLRWGQGGQEHVKDVNVLLQRFSSSLCVSSGPRSQVAQVCEVIVVVPLCTWGQVVFCELQVQPDVSGRLSLRWRPLGIAQPT